MSTQPPKKEGWVRVSNIMNILHLILSIFLGFGGFVAPIGFLPTIIIMNIILLARYHDYCFISEITRVVQEWGMGCDDNFDFSHETSEVWSNLLGIDVSKQALMNVSASLFGISAIVGLLRLILHHKIKFVPGRKTTFALIMLMALWLSTEVYLTFFYEKVSACRPTTPAATS